MPVSNKEAEVAIKTLLKWLVEDINREGLQNTPARVVRRYQKIFKGYHTDLQSILENPTIACEEGMNMIIVPDVEFISFCEHDLLPTIGKVNVAYLPSQKLAGIGALIKIINVFTHRLQIQERLTIQIVEAIEKYLNPKGIAIMIQAKHYCKEKEEAGVLYNKLVTSHFSGLLKTDIKLQNQFFGLIDKKQN